MIIKIIVKLSHGMSFRARFSFLVFLLSNCFLRFVFNCSTNKLSCSLFLKSSNPSTASFNISESMSVFSKAARRSAVLKSRVSVLATRSAMPRSVGSFT